MRFARVRTLLALGGLLALAAPLTAQGGTVTGRVTSSQTAAPIGGVRVEVLSTSGQVLSGGLSDASGQFRIAGVGTGSYTVVATMIGFDTQRQTGVQVAAGGVTTVNFELVPRALELNPIVVSASKRVERALEAPARVEVVGAREIAERPAVQPVDHLRAVPGVDIVSQGVQSSNVVARGFNNIFSGALMALTDHRIAGIPSLRVNALYMVPANNEDIERIEVVLGPGSALYGPNTANGVMHMFTRSPLTSQGTSASVTGGEQELLKTDFRTSHLIGENVGVKLSGQYVRGQEWQYVDSAEVQARGDATANPAAFRANLRALGVGDAEIDQRLARIGVRDYGLERWSLDGRVDARLTPTTTLIFSGGRSTTVSGVELTGVGASQIRDWSYDYYQARLSSGRLFAQTYMNVSDAGQTFTLRDGAPIIDRSRLLVSQLQHGFTPTEWQNFTYGIDYIRTMPETEGTIHGRFEDEDEYSEAGIFLQSETALGPRFDLVLAGRIDQHSVVGENVFSPRAALVFKPVENHVFRATYNSAFSNPSSVNLFLDLGAGPVPGTLGQLGYSIRATGTGRSGFTFRQSDGSFLMRSPFAGNNSPLTINATNLWQMQVRAMMAVAGPQLAQLAQQMGNPNLPTQLASHLLGNAPAQMNIQGINPLTQERAAFTSVDDVPGIRESNTVTFEIGYKGILGDRLLVAADVWRSQKDNFVSPLMMTNAFVILQPEQSGAYAGQQIAGFLMAQGMPQQQAVAVAGQLAPVLAQIPGGVVTSGDFQGGPELFLTYRNFGNINLWGSDLSATALLTDQWSMTLGASFVSDDHFRTDGQIITLNAPKTKGSLALAYRNLDAGFNGEVRARYNAGFPVQSGVFIGIQCIQPGALGEDCVQSHTLMDMNLGYQIPQVRGTTIQLMVQNLFDTKYRSFAGVPEIGRMALLRLKYEF
jgi:outer membrane receptor for ferrienterochelin and colicins